MAEVGGEDACEEGGEEEEEGEEEQVVEVLRGGGLGGAGCDMVYGSMN